MVSELAKGSDKKFHFVTILDLFVNEYFFDEFIIFFFHCPKLTDKESVNFLCISIQQYISSKVYTCFSFSLRIRFDRRFFCSIKLAFYSIYSCYDLPLFNGKLKLYRFPGGTFKMYNFNCKKNVKLK